MLTTVLAILNNTMLSFTCNANKCTSFKLMSPSFDVFKSFQQHLLEMKTRQQHEIVKVTNNSLIIKMIEVYALLLFCLLNITKPITIHVDKEGNIIHV